MSVRPADHRPLKPHTPPQTRGQPAQARLLPHRVGRGVARDCDGNGPLEQPPLGRYVFSVVRQSRMKCPHNVGRDSWVWGEQETLCKTDSPHEVGEEAFTERSSLSGGNGVACGCK